MVEFLSWIFVAVSIICAVCAVYIFGSVIKDLVRDRDNWKESWRMRCEEYDRLLAQAGTLRSERDKLKGQLAEWQDRFGKLDEQLSEATLECERLHSWSARVIAAVLTELDADAAVEAVEAKTEG